MVLVRSIELLMISPRGYSWEAFEQVNDAGGIPAYAIEIRLQVAWDSWIRFHTVKN